MESLTQGRSQGHLHCDAFIFTLIGPARPEESSQSVSSASRHDVNMKVRHALTHGVVDGNECAISFHHALNLFCQQLGVQEDWTDKGAREICKRFIMLF